MLSMTSSHLKVVPAAFEKRIAIVVIAGKHGHRAMDASRNDDDCAALVIKKGTPDWSALCDVACRATRPRVGPCRDFWELLLGYAVMRHDAIARLAVIATRWKGTWRDGDAAGKAEIRFGLDDDMYMEESAVSSRPATPALVHSPSTARSSFSLREQAPVLPVPWDAKGMVGPPPPEPPHIHTPPSSPHVYPFLPSHEPRGADRPDVSVQVDADKYLLSCRMPHFDHSSITVATRRGRLLVVAADRWEPLGLDSAHFERRVTFGWDADMARIRAEFDGLFLRITVPRRQLPDSLGRPHVPSHPSSRDVAWPLG
ncbi:hypothetical protein CTheo_4259 [Ceratobasidium theobromae]|uniref:SHSP domain-containing protein n=1 Tax=Ceratobasidium theobromae TaxID=1582974 RepID=A0A5N5QKK1_9AGAM|nr:hypothetical protein CTheo_4259 [Ceratobasidium theobromae]